MPARTQIRIQERDLFGDIDPAERRLELHAIKCDQPRPMPDDVPRMQVAVTLAHAAFRSPRIDLGGERRETCGSFGAQVGLGAKSCSGGALLVLLNVLDHDSAYLLGRAPRVSGARCRQPG